MKFVLYILALFLAENTLSQEIEYYIHFPPGGRLGVKELPTSIDTSHFYTYREIRDLAEPADGWETFYRNIDTLDYPKDAKAKKLESSMIVAYRIDENGLVDSVYVSSVRNNDRWSKCASCEALIIDYFKNTKWTPGRIGEVAVKSIDSADLQFIIRDPNSKKVHSPFDY
jgi:hypothetical protein